jgi:hypothetical protein
MSFAQLSGQRMERTAQPICAHCCVKLSALINDPAHGLVQVILLKDLVIQDIPGSLLFVLRVDKFETRSYTASS